MEHKKLYKCIYYTYILYTYSTPFQPTIQRHVNKHKRIHRRKTVFLILFYLQSLGLPQKQLLMTSIAVILVSNLENFRKK